VVPDSFSALGDVKKAVLDDLANRTTAKTVQDRE
jgi:hypothetical protein